MYSVDICIRRRSDASFFCVGRKINKGSVIAGLPLIYSVYIYCLPRRCACVYSTANIWNVWKLTKKGINSQKI